MGRKRSKSLKEIAVLGWGSLVWDKRDLKLSSKWHRDGPHLPIEYSRVSSGGRLTLVIVPGVKEQPTLWAFSNYDRIDEARENLRIREGNTRPGYIGEWEKGRKPDGDPIVATISKWAEKKGITKVIWTAIPPLNESTEKRHMSAQESLAHLRSLSGEAKKKARQYIVRTPEQVDTEVRRLARAELGWKNRPPSKRFFED